MIKLNGSIFSLTQKAKRVVVNSEMNLKAGRQYFARARIRKGGAKILGALKAKPHNSLPPPTRSQPPHQNDSGLNFNLIRFKIYKTAASLLWNYSLLNRSA
jgi:hypothetical protein